MNAQDLHEFLEAVKSTAEDMIKKDGKVPPALFFIKNKDIGLLDARPFMQSGPTKELWTAILNNMRKQYPVVVFASEIWMIERTESQRAVDRRTPADCEDRQEYVMLMIYQGADTDIIHAPINRDNNGVPTLGGWDTPDYKVLKGRFIER